jgi:hypothetical protein
MLLRSALLRALCRYQFTRSTSIMVDRDAAVDVIARAPSHLMVETNRNLPPPRLSKSRVEKEFS